MSQENVSEGGNQDAEEEPAPKSQPCDAMIRVFPHPQSGESNYDIITESKHKDSTRLNGQLVDWLLGLQALLIGKDVLRDGRLRIYTRIKRGDCSFRAHPNYRGKGPWRDWAWFDFGRKEKLVACHMWSFVTLPPMKGKRIDYGGIRLKEGVFAVVECAKEAKLKEDQLDLDVLFPVDKEVEWIDEEQKDHKKVFYLADTDALVQPACVVPNIGGPANQYFVIESRTEWAPMFSKWLETDDNEDMVISDDERADAQEAVAAAKAAASQANAGENEADPLNNDQESVADDLSNASQGSEDSYDYAKRTRKRKCSP